MGWINAAGEASPTGAADAHASLRRVLGYTGADIVEAACVRVPVPRAALGPDGLVADPDLRERIAAALVALAARRRRARLTAQAAGRASAWAAS